MNYPGRGGCKDHEVVYHAGFLISLFFFFSFCNLESYHE